MTDSFIPYPNIEDDNFYDVIFAKKEFNRTRYRSDYKLKTTEELCTKGEFKMQNHQEFVRNFLSPETPYNGVLLFQGTGVGKTCAAIGMTEGLKEYVKGKGKIYILSSENIRPNFYKELYDPRREEIENQFHSLPGSYQCAGDSYYVTDTTGSAKEKAIKSLIRKYYEFYGFDQFANFVDIGLGGDLPSDMEMPTKLDPDGNAYDIGDYFKNSVIVIDEAHGIAGQVKSAKDVSDKGIEDYMSSESEEEEDDESDEYQAKRKVRRSKRSLFKVLIDTVIPECHKRGHTIKIILLTATPMKDNVRELADLLELLNINDKRLSNKDRVWRKELFPKTMTVEHIESDKIREGIKQLARGYVSYVKGNNHMTFPEAREPLPELLYNPGRETLMGPIRPIFDFATGKDIQDEYDIKLPNGDQFMLNLVKCPMSLYQFLCYTQNVKSKTEQGNSESRARALANIAFPHKKFQEILDGQSVDITKTYGNSGFKEVFKITRIKEGDNIFSVYSIQSSILSKYGNILSLDNKPVALNTFSSKISSLIRNINEDTVHGISYVYSEFVGYGALLSALALEANGFIAYSPGIKTKLNKLGLPSSKRDYSIHRLKLPDGYIKDPKEFYRCALCGKVYNKCRKDHKDHHNFRISTYILVTGEIGNVADIAEASKDNINGEKVKVIVGTKTTSQGVDLKWVRKVHIIDPWHNNTRIYQAIGRGIRHCSHADLPPEKRNVTIYKYSASTDMKMVPPDGLQRLDEQVIVNNKKLPLTYRDYYTETIDEHIYSRAAKKDFKTKKIERYLKESAIDCELNRMRNYYEGDKDYSRACDYDVCKYSCTGMVSKVEYIRSIRKYDANNNWYIVDDEGSVIEKNTFNKIRHVEYYTGKTANPSSAWEILKRKNTSIRGNDSRGNYKEVLVDIPLKEIDTSTYNAYFSLPQIDRSVKIITRLFQKYITMSLERIIYFVGKIDPTIDEQFIYLGIDSIIGNPPTIPPKPLVDKYGRQGTVIYHNGFYIFQPDEIIDKRINMRYRLQPLSVKPRFFDMGKLNIKAVEERPNLQLEKSSDKEESSILKSIYEIPVDSSVIFIPQLNNRMESLTYSEHIYMIEYIGNKMFSEKRLEDINVRDAYILEYYLSTGLVLFHGWSHKSSHPKGIVEIVKMSRENKKYSLVHFFSGNTANVKILRYGKYDGEQKWYWGVLPVDSLDYYFSGPVKTLKYPTAPGFNGKKDRGLKLIRTPLNDSEESGLFGYYAKPRTSRGKEPVLDNSTFINVLFNAVKNIKTQIKTRSDTSQMRFKIVDKAKRKGIITKGGKESKKTELRGLVCSSSTVNDINSIHKRLNKILLDNKELVENYEDMDVESYAEFVKLAAGNKNTKCLVIQSLMQVMDFIGIEGKRWYLSPLDVENYVPVKK